MNNINPTLFFDKNQGLLFFSFTSSNENNLTK